jgi:hypothetical protein
MKNGARAVNAAYDRERAAWAACKQTGNDVDAANGHAAWLAAVEAANKLVREHPVELVDPTDPPAEDHPS